MKTRWTWLGGVPVEAVEVVTEGATSLEVNVLPAEPPRPAPEPFAAQPAQDVVDAPAADAEEYAVALALAGRPLPDAEAALMPPALGEAAEAVPEEDVPVNLAAAIRGGYTSIFAFASGAGTVVVDQAANLGLPPYWTVAITAIGAGVGYATKKRIKPNGIF